MLVSSVARAGTDGPISMPRPNSSATVGMRLGKEKAVKGGSNVAPMIQAKETRASAYSVAPAVSTDVPVVSLCCQLPYVVAYPLTRTNYKPALI